MTRFLVVIALTLIVQMLPTPPGLTEQGQSALALFVSNKVRADMELNAR